MNDKLVSPKVADVFLRGDRNYVQGTQIISRGIEFCGEFAIFKNATFYHTTTNLVTFTDSECQDSIARLGFVSNGLDKVLYVQEDCVSAPRKNLQMPISCKRQYEEQGVSVYHCDLIESFEGVLNCIVSCVRKEHDFIAENPGSVWLTGMRNWELSYSNNWPSSWEVRLRLLRSLKRKQPCQTLWNVDLAEDKVVKHSGIVTFSYIEGSNDAA